MKKLYAILAAAAVTLSATAAPLNINVEKVQLRGDFTPKKETTQLRKAGKLTSVKPNLEKIEKLAGKRITGMRKADSNPSIEGTWLFDLGDYYFQSSTLSTINVEFEATLDGRDLMFEDPTGYELPFVGVYNPDNGSITFNKEYLGTSSGYYIYQEPFVYNYDTNDLDVQSIVGTYYADYGVITFKSDNGISWPAYTNRTGTSMAGYFSIYDLEGASKIEEDKEEEPIDEVEEGQWETVGNATFVDAWILPSYTMGGVQINPNEYAYEVELQQNTVDKNLYRLWKPYTNGESLLSTSGLNQSTYEGQIVLDVSDPNHVVVVCNGKPAGFKNNNGEFYLANELGFYMNMGYDKQLVIDVIYEGQPADTYKNGVVTITSPMFDFSPAYANGYSWNNNPYSAIITFPGASESDEVSGTGNLTAQLDMYQGTLEEPELNDPENFTLEATYANGQLTLSSLAENEEPIVFNVDLKTGDLVALPDQLAYSEEVDEDLTYDYYYSDVATKTATVYGNIVNYEGQEKSFITLQPWGAGMDFEGFGYFFNNAYYNTEITLDFAIPGLEAVVTEPTLEIGDVTYNAYPATSESIGAKVNFNVPVIAEGIELADVTVYYRGPLDDDFVAVTENHERFEFDLTGLNFGTTYTVDIYAQAGNVKSETKTVEFTTFNVAAPEAKVTFVFIDEEEITETTANIFVVYTAKNIPDGGKAYVIVTDDVTRTDTKVEVEEAEGFEAEVNLTGLTPDTEYNIMTVVQIDDAEGNIVTRSNIDYKTFKTAAAPAVASLVINNVETDENTEEVTFYITYTAENLPEGVVYKVRLDNYETGPVGYFENASAKEGVFEFTLTEFVAGTYGVTLYAYEGEEIVMSSAMYYPIIISTSGIAGIEADMANGVEYFNLQGVRITTPAAGNVYIRRAADGTATRVLVK